LLQWVMEDGFATIEKRLDEVLANLPGRGAAGLLRLMVLSAGPRRGPSDELTRACAALLLEPSAARDRITPGLIPMRAEESLARLERAFELVARAAPIHDRLHRDGIRHWQQARDDGRLNAGEAEQLEAAEKAVAAVVAVDDFAPEDIVGRPRQ
jgi:hypothetical protein